MASGSPIEKLPMEIFHQIIQQVEGPKAPLSTISRSWQAAVEKEAFSTITLDSDNDSLARFGTAFSNEANTARRSFLKSLTYNVILQPVSEKRLRKLQNKAERARNNRAFTQALVHLSEQLVGWVNHGRGIHLILHLECSTDHESESEHTPLQIHRGSRTTDIRNDLAYIELDKAVTSAFPPITSITRFSLGPRRYRNLHPDTYLALFNCMPNLVDVNVYVQLPERRQPLERRLIRNAFGRLLQEAPFHSLRSGTIFSTEYEPRDDRYTLEDFTDENGNDSLSLGVRRLLNLPTLESLCLEECFSLSPAAFTGIFSPSLKNVDISLAITVPDGNWYLTGDPKNPSYVSDHESEGSQSSFVSDNSSQSDYCPEYTWLRESGDLPMFDFRLVPDDRAFGPLMEAITRAVRCGMPILQQMDVTLGACISQMRVEMSFYAPDQKPHCWEDDYKEFHERQAGKARCVMHVWGDLEDVVWELGPRAKRALAEAYDEDCVFIKLRQR